jgi:methylenetetrahydrofolate dehydrogenase (NAD+)|tara:strand:+ start:20384 stop:21319 length:936 start_codon:yes stop_codon:yes gene_type:complete
MTTESQKINIAEYANKYKKQIRDKITTIYKDRTPPKLVGIMTGDDAGAKMYSKWTGRSCKKDNIDYELVNVSKEDIISEIYKQMNDDTTTGIIVYYPIYGLDVKTFMGNNKDDYLRDTISINKDVEGLNFFYRNNLYRNIRFIDEKTNKKCLLPCTALSIVKILEELSYDKTQLIGKRLSGKTIGIVNRSEIVGKPLAAMLHNDGAEVYSIDIDTIYKLKDNNDYISIEYKLDEVIKKCDIIITGVPVKKYKLPLENVQEGTVLINFSHFKNIDEEEVMKINGIKYVASIGKMTIAMLERNLLRLYENNIN